MLNIQYNDIREEGVEYLAGALNINQVRFDLVVCVISVSLFLFEDTHNIVSVHEVFQACSDESAASTRFKDRDCKRKYFHLFVLLDATINSRMSIVTAVLTRMHCANIAKK
jgi:hypothetical protein